MFAGNIIEQTLEEISRLAETEWNLFLEDAQKMMDKKDECEWVDIYDDDTQPMKKEFPKKKEQKNPKYIGSIQRENTNFEDWTNNLKKTGQAIWAFSATAGELHTPQKGDIIAVRVNNPKNKSKYIIPYYVEVLRNSSKHSEHITEGSDIKDRNARDSGNQSFNVRLYKELDTPVHCQTTDIPHPSKDGIVKRQTTFKPIYHLIDLPVVSPKLKPYINMIK